MPQSGEDAQPRSPLAIFFLVLFALAAARIGLNFLRVPDAMSLPLSIVATVVFLVVPVLALFKVASARWTAILALAFIVSGLIAQFGLLALLKGPLKDSTWLASVALAISQVGLITWCVGIGALLTTMLKDKNLIIPVSIFLALFDIFAVFTPSGPVQVLMRTAPQMLPNMAYQAPAVASMHAVGPIGAPVRPFAFVGPADFLFMGMFFVAVFRFNLRAKATFKWMLVALAIWIGLAHWVGDMPLLVPIGLSVLLVNLPEFKLNKEEWASTAVIAAIMTAVVIWGATRPRPSVRIEQESPVGPSPSALDSIASGSGGSPLPTSPGPRPTTEYLPGP